MIGFVIGIIAAFIIAIGVIAEHFDKIERQRNNLPPKKYHDINDYDVQTVYIHEIK